MKSESTKKKRGRGSESPPDGCELQTPQRISDNPVVALYGGLKALFETAATVLSEEQLQDFQTLAHRCGKEVSIEITLDLIKTVRDHVTGYLPDRDRNCCNACLDFILAAFRDLSRINEPFAIDIRNDLIEILKFQSALIVWVEKIEPNHDRQGTTLTVHTNDTDRFMLLFGRIDHGHLLDTQSGVIIFDR